MAFGRRWLIAYPRAGRRTALCARHQRPVVEKMVNNRDLTPEFALVAACCRWPATAERRCAVAETTQSTVDWQRVLRIATRHRVSGLVAAAIRDAGVAMPPDILSRLSQEEARIALHNVRSAAESHRLMQTLAADGIDALLLKGVTLNLLAYGGLGLKESRDIDLLVAPERFDAASRALARSGYRRLSPAPELDEAETAAWMSRSKESAWLHAAEGHLVELHVALADNAAMIAGIGLESPRQSVDIGGGRIVQTLADAELLAYLFLHGATHGWARLKWLADVNALLSGRGPDAIEQAYRAARAYGAGRGAAQGLLLCARLFGLDLGAALAAELEADGRTRYMVRVALNLIAGRFVEAELDDHRFGTIPLHISHFFLLPGLKAKFGVLAQKLRTPFGAGERGARIPILSSALSIPIWLWRRGRLMHKAGRPEV